MTNDYTSYTIHHKLSIYIGMNKSDQNNTFSPFQKMSLWIFPDFRPRQETMTSFHPRIPTSFTDSANKSWIISTTRPLESPFNLMV